MEFTINIAGLDGIAAAINNMADALKVGAKADQIIETAKASASTGTKKPAKATPAAAVDSDMLPEGTTPATPAETAAFLAPAPAPAALDTAHSEPITRETIQTVCRAISKKSGPGDASEIISKFGFKYAKDVPDSQLPGLYNALKSKLNSLEAANG